MRWHQIPGLLCFLFFLHSSHPLASPLCPRDQSDALLQFKDSFMLDKDASSFTCDDDEDVDTSYPKTNSWNKSMDCCSWDGINCDKITGNIIGMDLSCSWLSGALHSNSSLFLLRHLQSLNLFGNDFVGSHISPNLSTFVKMTHLNLSFSNFLGTVPSEISHLSKLVSLDLSRNFDLDINSYLRLENSIFTKLVQNLTDLTQLNLDKLDMSMVSPMSFMNLSSSLTHLSISSCTIRGIFPDTIFRSPSLLTLDISSNAHMSGILPKSNWTGPLMFLYLAYTNFSGEIPDSIGNKKSLMVLDLQECKFTGHIPSSIADLKQLQILMLAGNNFSGRLPIPSPSTSYFNAADNGFTGEIPSSICQLQSLQDLLLQNNSLFGNMPPCFGNMTNLSYLDLSENKFQGPLLIPVPSTSHFFAYHNGFIGEIPSSICQLSSLQQLDLSNNSLSGNLPPCFHNITNLSNLDLSKNKFQGPLLFPPSTSYFYASHNGFTGEIPSSICQLSSLYELSLSNNSLSGNMPPCFGNMTNLLLLDLRSNNFIGRWPMEVFSKTKLLVVDLSNNKFGGPIPLPCCNTFYYSIANNDITGKIPSLICNATELEIIDLSNNGLTGSLPRCLTNFSTDLSVLKLQMNRLWGTIPQSFYWRNSLMTLDLSRNRFEGTLPRSLVKCKYLEVLDLSDNRIEDTFPKWLGTLPELKVLILRSNNFKGHLNIPRGHHLFPNLHILDLSKNNFHGPLPANLLNLKAMMNDKNGQDKPLYMTRYIRKLSYENSVTVTMKGHEIELVKILTVFTTIDLSHNSFQGNIPKVFGHLHCLIGLNLSHNHLTGSIPPTLGNLTDLEWLDLSSNKLSGEIPRVLGDLASLGYLNLSKNQLIGRIPQDKQLSTFSSESVSGNLGLCGTPLPKAWPSNARPPPPSSSSTFNFEGHGSWFEQKAMAIGYASGIVIGISIIYIALEMGRPKWLARGVRILERRATKWMEKPKRKANKFHGQ
ncbi:receptor-like protein 43 [Syzygium oleosum]|uniref:receptor-like protein 43 n=1 Tax=Syzygium oleosum TaxID=219896 RepID=UPI0024BAF2CE|nr:receptor-like protein 43 [Syzygium oleosum]